MSDSIDAVIPSGEKTAVENSQYETVGNKIPQWLIKAPGDLHRTLRAMGPNTAPWFVNAMRERPGLARLLKPAYGVHRRLESRVQALLARIPDLEVFAEPLLNAAIQKRFNLSLNVRTTWLFHAGRVQADDSFLALSRDPLVESSRSIRVATQTLLRAALQNFEAWEAEPGGMQHARLKSSIYIEDEATQRSTPVDIEPEAFAALCRTLDLGGQYQTLIDSVLNAPVAAAGKNQLAFLRFEGAALVYQAHMAYLKNDISQPLYNTLIKRLTRAEPARTLTSLRCSFLTLWDIELTGIVVASEYMLANVGIGPPQWVRDRSKGAVIVYIPDDPFNPLKEYASFQQFQEALRDKLFRPQYLKFFERFVPARHRSEVFGKIRKALYPKVWNSGGWYEEGKDSNAELVVGIQIHSGAVLTDIVRQKIAVLRDDALFHAVPTADEDQKTHDARLRYFAGLAFDALNLAAFVMPGLGMVMLAITAAQLGYEVYEGFHSLSQGDRDQAWDYLMDVVENLAQIAASGAVWGAGRGVPALEVPAAVAQMRTVRLEDGSHRLWQPDLRPFAHDIVLPAGLKPDALGLYSFQGKRWLPLEERVFCVQSDTQGAAHYLRHPERADAYQPVLRSNGAGGWLHELDQPLEWEGLTLLQRLGPLAHGLSDQAARRLLQVSNTYPAQLRRALADSARPPALLVDTLERMRLDKEIGAASEGLSRSARAALFATRYDAQQAQASAEVRLLTGAFSGLPVAVADELLAQADAAELAQLRDEHKVPLRLAEEARVFLQSVRLARAYEGFYLQHVDNADSDILVLHSLETLPGWSPQVRLEVRERSLDGPLIDSVGAADAPIHKVLLKGAEGYQVAGFDHPLAAMPPDDLYAAVLEALPLEQQKALGVVPGGKAALRLFLHEQPLLPRPQARQALQMQPEQPVARSPMRLADGRLGYPLSGRGALATYISEETLLDKIRQLEFPDIFAEAILQALYSVGLSRAAISVRLDELLEEQGLLLRSLTRWRRVMSLIVEPSEAHMIGQDRIALGLWEHWRANNLPEIGRTDQPLRLESIFVSDFPEQLPAFVYDRVHGLVLRDFVVGMPASVFGADGVLHYEGALPPFLQRFPQARTLEIHHSIGWPVRDLPRVVAMSCPHLRRLHLNNLQLNLEWLALEPLAGLTELQHLDLSGNFLVDAPSIHFVGLHLPSQGLHLRALGNNLTSLSLNRVGMTRWPNWLDSQALSRISELSLVGNRLLELPTHILQNEANATQHTRVALQGNVLSRQAILNTRLSEGSGRRFSFDMDIPDVLQADLDLHQRECAQLIESLEMWRETSSSTRPLGDQQIAARRRVADSILAFWQEKAQGNASPLLQLDSLALDDFPRRLPDFFYQRVRRMELLMPVGTSEALNLFLEGFSQMEELAISGRTPPATALPSALRGMPALRSLALNYQGVRIDQAAVDLLAELPALSSLELDGNTLGTITNVSGLAARHFELLSLNEMGIDTWPAWLEELIPQGVEVLSLENNLLTELPEYLLANHRNPAGLTEISLLDNPLTYETMRRAYISVADNRPFIFEITLPDDIQQLQGEAHLSDSDESVVSLTHSHGGSMSLDEDDTPVDFWLTGSVAENEMRRGIWEQLEGFDAADLLRMVGRLRYTADYRNAVSRPELIARVWRVLDVAVQNIELRQTLNGMAQEPLRQLRNYDTCPDGIRLEFNQMEVQVFTIQSLQAVPEQERGSALYRLVRRLYRLHELDTIAREAADTRDEAEVRLVYRLHWAEELDLPLPPSRMLYRTVADVRPAELDRALEKVRQGEGGQPFLSYAAQQDFWVAYLREVYAERFNVVNNMFQARVLELIDLYPDDMPERSSERIRELEAQLRHDERSLVDELTILQGHAHD
ncbi:NEL-type E3 ubiquitin ligase domain-containing protein [Pseudomonas sp. Marseille-P9899]|uniref:NEL-type E3 ubiquitin ligase domain-containing protein n=1 Tax=Pseudomonas sp. Marseille-P9899 TaxID=2730401 RepID=UPI00158A8547|nr:DUF6543 domain-containing protein [Pseudomonas sp. Marseille-P9899]